MHRAPSPMLVNMLFLPPGLRGLHGVLEVRQPQDQGLVEIRVLHRDHLHEPQQIRYRTAGVNGLSCSSESMGRLAR